ncbi:hypothetical protein [Pantoea sp. App145]|uniref:hypothetical protein n=1 Tax=Pantoea sp. App145 TaxID=3071567 RepID=UPI003A7F8D22
MNHLVETIADLLSYMPLIGGTKKDKKSSRNRISDLEYKPVCRVSENKSNDKNPLRKQQLPGAE